MCRSLGRLKVVNVATPTLRRAGAYPEGPPLSVQCALLLIDEIPRSGAVLRTTTREQARRRTLPEHLYPDWRHS